MKLFIVYMVAFLATFGECKKNNKWRKEMPPFFIEKFQDWNNNNTCEYERMKSIGVNISLTRMDAEFVHTVRTKLAADGYPLKKIELRIYIQGLSRRKAETMAKGKFIANVQPLENLNYRRNLTFSPNIVKGKQLELTFDITFISNTSINDFHSKVNFDLRILRRNGKTVRSLMRNNLKAYAILYESVESCNFMDFVRRDDHFQRSPDVLHNLEVARPGLKSLPAITDGKLCRVKRFPVNLMEIGFQWIIFPEEMDIGICEGLCPDSSVGTGYRFMLNSLYSKSNRGQPSTCQPTEYGGMTIIYIDSSDGKPVIQKFSDMVVKQCGCL